MEIKTIGDATVWYNNHCRTLDDWGKMAMKNIWDCRKTDEEKIEFVRSVQYAKEQVAKAHPFQEQVDRIVAEEEAHKFVQIAVIPDLMEELIALDARGKMWHWINTGTEYDLSEGHWQELNPERVPYGLKKKTINQLRAERGLVALEDISGSGYEGDLR